MNFRAKSLLLVSTLALSACSPKSAATSVTTAGIQGGVDASYAASPSSSIVAILDYSAESEEISFECTGVIVSKNLILTAAHCIDGEDGDGKSAPSEDDKKFVYFGSGGSFHALIQKFNDSSLKGEQPFREITDTVVHPKYAGSPGCVAPSDVPQNDIAVMKVDDIPSYAQVANFLPDDSSLTAGATVQVYGYGATNADTKAKQIILRSLETSIESWETKTRQFILATTGAHSVIQGDSGGPAFITSSNGLRLWGLNSGFVSVKSDGDPTHSRIESVVPQLKWLKQAAKELGAPF